MRTTHCLMATLAGIALAALAAQAQTGMLRGIIHQDGGSQPVVGATVRVMPHGDTTRTSAAYSNVRGEFTVRDLPPGGYRVVVTAVGFARMSFDNVTIVSAQEVTLDVAMRDSSVMGNAIVVTASRKREKITEAPASVSVVTRREIEERPALTLTDHIRTMPGIAYAQTSVQQQSVTVRNGNSVFSGDLLVLSDNRSTNVPSLGINYYSLFPLINDDIEQIELVRGPASALYGANATLGVLNVITRSPFTSQGTLLTVSGGQLSTVAATLRHAGVVGERFGYKISGRYLRSNDFVYIDTVEVALRDTLIAHGADPDTLKVGARDSRAEAFSVEGRMDYVLNDNATLTVDGGLGEALNGVQQIGTAGGGAVQARDWQYWFGQARLSWDDLFVQAYLNRSAAGKTFYLRTGLPVIDRSYEFVAQAQHRASIGEWEHLTYGVDANLLRPVSDSSIYGDNEGHTGLDQFGAYVQSQTNIIEDLLDLTLTLRLDKHSEIDKAILSPRAALLLKPWDDGAFRFTYNRAFAPPNAIGFFLDILGNPNPFNMPAGNEVRLRARGTPPGGYPFDRDANGRPYFHSQFVDRSQAFPVDSIAQLWPVLVALLNAQGVDLSNVPPPSTHDVGTVMGVLNLTTFSFDPVNNAVDIPSQTESTSESYELGFQGSITDGLSATIDAFTQRGLNYTETIMVTPNVFWNKSDLQNYLTPFVGDSNAAQIAAQVAGIPFGTVSPRGVSDPTAVFLGNRTTSLKGFWFTGIDIGLDYRLTDEWTLSGTASYVDRDLNGASRHRGSLTIGYRSAPLGLNAELRYRGNEGYQMNQGVYVGYVPSFHLVDLNVGYVLPSVAGMKLTLTAMNLLDDRHQEFVGAPYIGRFVMGTVNYQF